MRLNMDCVRDILLCVEENTGLRQECFFIDLGLTETAQWLQAVCDPPPYQASLLEKYGNDTLIYHVYYCFDAALIVKTSNKDRYKIHVADLSPSGHELLGKIRDTKQWGAVKKATATIRDYSLSALSAIAEGVTSAAISAYFSKTS